MAITDEAAFEQKLANAVEEAVNEVDAVEEDADVDVEEESVDEPVESEQEIDEPFEADDEAEAESEDVEQEDEAPTVIQWSGNPDELPPAVEHEGKIYDLTQTYKAMQAGWTKKTQELAEQRKQYEAMTRQYQEMIQAQKQQAAVAADPRPADPTADMSPEDQSRRWDDINRWIARDENRKMVESGQIPDPSVVQRQIELQQQQASLVNRLNMIAAQPGYNEAVDQRMVKIVENDQTGYWTEQFSRDEGALALFELAKNQLDAEQFRTKAVEAENAKVRRKASAGKKATPKQAAQNKMVERKPADNFAELGFEDKVESIIRSEFGL